MPNLEKRVRLRCLAIGESYKPPADKKKHRRTTFQTHTNHFCLRAHTAREVWRRFATTEDGNREA